MTWFDFAIFTVAIFAGATASVVGFGIGSLLTPLLAASYGTGLAVAAVTIPHAIATAVRCWRLRAAIDRRVLVRFGLLSAAGGLGGALLYTRLGPSTLTKILGGLLLLTAAAQLTGWSKRWHPHGPIVALLGLGSGFFGGIAGNQGGLRAAALTAFGLSPAGFVATATATGLVVDFARAPVYLWTSGPALAALWKPIGVTTAGVLIGTFLGERILLGLSPKRFVRMVAAAIGGLGLWLLFGGAR
ncbi:MAG TPA: TSUP family transporter [Candidatus Eisenbacteria bacterium]|nr:TSUP family transporter [Candidatus Eisenbacteria bacterium]